VDVNAGYDVNAAYKESEVGMIPEDWQSTTVAEIASSTRNAIVGGPFGSDLVSRDYVDRGVPVIRGQNMGGLWVSGNFVFVSPGKADSLQANLARPGDIVFTQRGTLGQVSLVPDGPYDRYLISQSQMKLTANREVADPRFLYYVFLSSRQQEIIRQNTIQTSLPHINLGILRKIPVQLAPLPEQRAIADELGDVDALIRALDRLIAKKHDLKQAAMQQLLTGKTRLPGFRGKWKRYRFSELFQFLNTANHPRADLSLFGDVGYIHYGDVHTTASPFLDCTAADLPLIKCAKVLTIPPIQDGDVIMVDASEDYEGMGKSVEVRHVSGRRIVAGLHTLLLRGNKELLADGFKGYLQFIPSVKASLVRLATGISVYGVSKRNVKSVEVMLPSIDEQSAIASVLSDMDAEIAALEQRRDKTRDLKQGMMQELLTGRTRLI